MNNLSVSIEGLDLDVRRFSIDEQMSRPFAITLTAVARYAVDLEAALGKPARFAVTTEARDRAWHGVCGAISLRRASSGLSTYDITIVPALSLLSHGRRYRIFEDLSLPDIVGPLLSPCDFRVAEVQRPRPYTVQYAESDLSFCHRLLEEAGIAYTIAGERVILSDRFQVGDSVRSMAGDIALSRRDRAVAGPTVRASYDFQRPDFAVCTQADGRGMPACEDYALVGVRRALRPDIESQARVRDEVSFKADDVDIKPGDVVTIEDRRYLLTSTHFAGERDGEWELRADAVSADRPYRPPLRTPRPVVHGVQTAIVDSADTDDHGRVRVTLPWHNHASCWIRVSSGSAGTGFGMIALPQAGQDVLIAFEHGDPDHPIVVGRLYNAAHPSPQPLPEMSLSGHWRSQRRNAIALHDQAGSETIALSAERDLRRLVLHADVETFGRDRTREIQGNAVDVVNGTRRLHARGDGQTTVERGQRRQTAGARRRVGGAATHRIMSHRLQRVAGAAHVSVGERRHHDHRDRHVRVGGEHMRRVAGRAAIDCGADRHVKCHGSAAVYAAKIGMRSATGMLEASDVTLKAAGGFVRISDEGVTIAGTVVRINEGGSAGTSSAAVVDAPSEPTLALTEAMGNGDHWVYQRLVDALSMEPIRAMRWRLLDDAGEQVAAGMTGRDGSLVRRLDGPGPFQLASADTGSGEPLDVIEVTDGPAPPDEPVDTPVDRVVYNLLVTDSGGSIPFFTQRYYRTDEDEFPIGNNRTIASAGCALCALVAYLNITACHIDGAPVDPRSFNQYLLRWIDEHDLDADDIYASSGALKQGRLTLYAAINALAAASHPDGPAPSYSTTAPDRFHIDPGEEVPGLCDHIDSGNPALLGVRRSGDSRHVVLVVGYVRLDGATYYLINDSAYPHVAGAPSAYMLRKGGPVTRERALLHAASVERSDDHPHRYMYKVRLLSGLSHFVGLHVRQFSP